jgi:hypothetical protein
MTIQIRGRKWSEEMAADDFIFMLKAANNHFRMMPDKTPREVAFIKATDEMIVDLTIRNLNDPSLTIFMDAE